MDVCKKCSIDKTLKIHKRILQIVYDVYDEWYENLLNRSDDIRYIKNICDTWLLKFINSWSN